MERLSGDERLLLFLALSSFIIDVAVNFSIYYGIETSVTSFLKLIIIFVAASKLREKNSYFAILVIITIILIRWLFILLNGSDIYIIQDFVYILRICYFVIWLLLFKEKSDRNSFNNYLINLFLIETTVSIFFQILGYSFDINYFKAYDTQRPGYKGLFFGENDTSIFYVLAFFYAVHLIKKNSSYIYPIIVAIGLVILALGSKAALLGLFMVPLLYFYFSMPGKIGISSKSKLFSKIRNTIFIFALLLVGFYGYINAENIFLAINYSQFLNLLNETGLATAVFSGRNLKVAEYFDSIKSFSDILFGLQIGDIADYMIEIDVFDYLMRVGLVGTLFVIYLIVAASRSKDRKGFTGESKALLLIVVILGATAGHVLLSTINGIWISFFIVYFAKNRIGNTNKYESFRTSKKI